MDFNLRFILAGVLFVVTTLSVTALRRLPLTTSILYLAVGIAVGPAAAAEHIGRVMLIIFSWCRHTPTEPPLLVAVAR